MGLYYSGGYDWTFVPGPIRTAADYQSVKPQSEAYGKYADAQFRELIERYHPAVLWNDIDYPKSGHPLELMAEYYNAVPDGVIDDRFGVKHSDFKSPEYKVMEKISPTKWEECRGLGRSFGYNRAEGEAETIAPDELIYLLVDIVSKNGNLLLDVGPEADGTIPPVQMSRLQALGAWLKQNGEAIYGTHPWKTAEGETAEGIHLRFTQKDSAVYATLLGKPKTKTISLKSLAPKAGTQIYLLGNAEPLAWSQQGRRYQDHASARSSGTVCIRVEDRGTVVPGRGYSSGFGIEAEVVSPLNLKSAPSSEGCRNLGDSPCPDQTSTALLGPG